MRDKGNIFPLILLAVGIVLLCIGLASCGKDPIRKEETNNPNVKVSLLFEHEGCKVFRFVDAGEFRYYATCQMFGGHEESCGKNCQEQIDDIIPVVPR